MDKIMDKSFSQIIKWALLEKEGSQESRFHHAIGFILLTTIWQFYLIFKCYFTQTVIETKKDVFYELSLTISKSPYIFKSLWNNWVHLVYSVS